MFTTVDADGKQIKLASTEDAGVHTPVVSGAGGGSGGGLTNTELRASAVPVSGPLTNTELRASAVPVSGPITSAQMSALTGAVAVAAWSGTGDGTLISILKALYLQNATIITTLQSIDSKTPPIA